MHVLCFNPYVRWTVHSARHNAVLHSLHLRKVRTLMVLCDGLMPECDLYQPAKGEKARRTSKSCNRCQTESSYLTAKNDVSYLWLGRWIQPDTVAKAQAWALEVQDLEATQYNGWPIGDWVRSSVHSYFRKDSLDLEDPTTNAVYRRHIAGGAVIATALDALFTHEKPDAQILFNGRMAPMRIALELAKLHGVRTITEERGFAPGYMRLVENTHCLDPKPFYALADAWKNIPLSEAELDSLQTLLDNHLTGSGHEIDQFAAPVAGRTAVLETLGIGYEKRLAVLYTSSTDEAQDQPETAGIFDHQYDWIRATIAAFAAKPDWHLVVRTHPNSGGKRSVGTNPDELQFIESITASCPENVNVVGPDDDISSFDLAQAADRGLIWHSSIGLEMAALGKPVFRAGQYWFRDADFMYAPESGTSYDSALELFLQESAGPVSVEKTVAAWRFAYCWFFRQSIAFPLVKQPDWARGEPAYDSLQDLMPGKDEGLDRVCSIILNGDPIHPQPEERPATIADIEHQMVSAFVAKHTKA